MAWVGGLTLVQTQSASSSATVTFSNIGSFQTYLLTWNTIVPSTSAATLQMQLSTNNGSTWVTTGYISFYNGTSSSISNFNISGSLAAATDYTTGSILLYNMNTAVNGQIIGSTTTTNLGVPSIITGLLGGVVSTSSLNAFKVFFNSGNITSGTFSLYAIAN